MNKIEYLVIHHTASKFGDVEGVTKWHLERGWRTIGYNALILNGYRKSFSVYQYAEDGLIESGRGLNIDAYIDGNEQGAHTLNYNARSIGVCFVSDGRPTERQENSLIVFCKFYRLIVPDIKIVGHNALAQTDCPGFDVQDWCERIKI